MAIKNGRYKDKNGNIRHFETNENMVVVDNGQRTLKQKFMSLLEGVSELTSKVTVLESDKVDKTQIKNSLAEVEVGNVLDASQGKVLNDSFKSLRRATFEQGFGDTLVDLGVNVDLFSLGNVRGVCQSTTNHPTEHNGGYGFVESKYLDQNWSEVHFTSFHTRKTYINFKSGAVWQGWQEVGTKKVYSGFGDVKQDFSQNTPFTTVESAMADNSILIASTYLPDSTNSYPSASGNLIITKAVKNRTKIEYIAYTGEYYFGYIDDGFMGWRQIATTDKCINYVNRTSVDLNTIINTGTEGYAHLCTNTPGVYDGYFKDYKCEYGDIGCQEFTQYADGRSFKRYRFSSIWQPWQEMATTQTVYPQLLNGWERGANCNFSYTKIGNRIFVSGIIVNPSYSGNNTIAMLPAPKDGWYGGSAVAIDGTSAYFVIDVYGNLQFQSGYKQGHYYSVTLSYSV